ncbi:hypothetical protein IT568_07415 [bacterium]|nr:hypothetical protein [bacterium]
MNFLNEILRKTIHLLYLLVPLSFYFLPKQDFFTFFIPLAVLCVLTDFLRLKISAAGKLFNLVFGKILREFESKRLTGASFFVLATLICTLVFPEKYFATAGLCVASVSDSFSALVGKRFGKTKIFRQKSLEGSFAFFVSAFFVVFAFPESSFLPALASAFVGTLVELYTTKIDDNLTVPLAVCTVLFLLQN